MNQITRYSNGSPSLRYIDHGGEGPTLLLLHGVTRCGDDWEPLMSVLTASWRVIALDQRGHGGSQRAESYLVTDYVADTVRFVCDELSTTTTIFGHSLGAMVAAAVAAELQNHVRGVILEDPPFHTMGERIDGSVWQAQFSGMRQVTMQGGSVEAITDAFVARRSCRRWRADRCRCCKCRVGNITLQACSVFGRRSSASPRSPIGSATSTTGFLS